MTSQIYTFIQKRALTSATLFHGSYSNVAHFIRQFHAHYGDSPERYRQKHTG
ncbi:MAG: hypothetical protein ACOCVT_00020 [bacterium]